MAGSKMRAIIGLTGPTGSGKTTMAKRLSEMGAHVLDADEIARGLQQPGCAGALAIQSAFGSEYFDEGRLNRAKLAELVFNDKSELRRLNDVMFPLIIDETKNRLQKLDGVCIIDAALLFEAGMDKICQRVWLARADDDVRKKRIMKRDGIGMEQAEQRMRSQCTDYPADEVIDTSMGLLSIEGRLRELLEDAEKLVKAD